MAPSTIEICRQPPSAHPINGVHHGWQAFTRRDRPKSTWRASGAGGASSAGTLQLARRRGRYVGNRGGAGRRIGHRPRRQHQKRVILEWQCWINHIGGARCGSPPARGGANPVQRHTRRREVGETRRIRVSGGHPAGGIGRDHLGDLTTATHKRADDEWSRSAGLPFLNFGCRGGADNRDGAANRD